MFSSLFNQKKPAFGRNKVRADIFPRFFGSFSIRKGRHIIGRRLDAPIRSGPFQMNKSVRIFSNAVSQLLKGVFLSSGRQPIFPSNWNFLSFVPPEAERAKSGLFLIPESKEASHEVLRLR